MKKLTVILGLVLVICMLVLVSCAPPAPASAPLLPHLPPSLPSWKNYGKPFCDKQQLTYIYRSDKALAKYFDSGATFL